MQEQFSRHSMLRSGMPVDDLALSGIIDSVERPIRAMCRVMQVYELHACNSMRNFDQDYEDLISVFSAFYQYIDLQMNRLNEISAELETGLSHVSPNAIRKSDDFRLKKLPREAFNSDERYDQYCATYNAARAPHEKPSDNAMVKTNFRESPFNDAFGDSVAPANKIRGGK